MPAGRNGTGAIEDNIIQLNHRRVHSPRLAACLLMPNGVGLGLIPRPRCGLVARSFIKEYSSGGYSKAEYLAKMKGNQGLLRELEEGDGNVLSKLTEKVNIYETAIWEWCSRMMIITRRCAWSDWSRGRLELSQSAGVLAGLIEIK